VQEFDFEKIQIKSAHQVSLEDEAINRPPNHGNGMESILGAYNPEPSVEKTDMPDAENIKIHREERISTPPSEQTPAPLQEKVSVTAPEVQMEIVPESKLYRFPPIDLLKKGKQTSGDSAGELRETAMRLQQTLNNFGVKVTITDISQGPSVTRYELQPEQGVKVSKIVSLTDDIKLNLAATDIRIEAPIPGKAAIGIEVPNKENMMVALRDLLESREYNDFNSNIAFAVGKDIAGKVVVADIAKMPHMLIAGSTGSGKSVCINTLIMSIIYKAHPDDVKLIMIDPKVVELSVYNGIPHLLLDVVTDPKKASAALHWGVTEMEDRYKKLAEFNVRDIKEYNKKVEAMKTAGDANAPAKMPQIVIIVDELADLMMVAPGEVEESICRLAQLARAAGIHLVIATQRPSVDVITGLIKANMPSRVAFAVSSGVDSRTILDMNGAEKLLGKGDMLFYPQGYSKPARIQGAFVSDGEVSDVVDFLKNQRLGNNYANDIEEKLTNIGNSLGGSGGNDSSSSRDEYFEQAGRFIIDKDKASIGMLQRVLKVGFNRAARIMDQLCDYGVVGEEEGTKPRKVLMSMEQFEQLLEEI
jgi:S-DNA-T family DNA segregation ATPase FtsK/SpoIIIE